MAEPKEIGTVWTLGCEVFVEDALTAEVQEIKVNDIVLSANIFTEGLSVEVGSDMVNAMDLDVRISMDGLKTYIIDSQIVPYEDVLKITDFSPEATNEKRYAASALSAKKIYDKTGVLESGLSSLKKRVDEIELNGVGGSGDSVWEIDEQGNIWTNKQVIIKNNLIVEGDTSSGGEGEDTPSAGLDETRLQEYLDEHKYVTEDDIAELIPSNAATVDYVDSKFNSIDLSPYAKTTELKALANRVTPIETWMDNVGQHITYDAELDAIVINHNLIVTKDTSSGGEGQDTPASGIRGIYVNGTPYTDTDGDGFIDLGTISGGVSGDYLPLAGGRITGNSLDIGREDNYASAFVKIITNASTSADYGTSIRHYEKSSGSYTYKGLLIDKNGAYYSNNGSNYGLIHSGNYSSFALPLSGGTLYNGVSDTPLYIKSDKGAAYIGFKNSSDAFLGYYGFNDTTPTVYIGTSAEYNIIHSGNIGSQNAGSATKLQTARTIWGQSFDGTGDVSGMPRFSPNTYSSSITTSSSSIVLSSKAASMNGYNTGIALAAIGGYDSNYQNHLHAWIGLGARTSTSGAELYPLVFATNNSTTTNTAPIERMRIMPNGNVLIGTMRDASRLTVSAKYRNALPSLGSLSANSDMAIHYDGDSAGYGMYFSINGYTGVSTIQVGRNDGNTNAYSLLLNPLGGNVGIGTTSPSSKLSVHSNAASALPSLGALATEYTIEFGHAGKYGTYLGTLGSGNGFIQQGRSDGTATAYNLLLQPLAGNVGIGTSSPAYSLDVAGTGRFTGAVTMSSTLTVGDATSTSTISNIYVTINTTSTGGWERAIRFQQNGSDKFCLGAYGTGSVMYYGYIGTSYTAPWVKFTPTNTTFNGNVIVTGDTSSGSDIRFKDVIKNKTLKIEHIAKAPLFTFKWNDREDDVIHLGSSAQYWENICPWLVTGEDFKSLNYSTLGVAMGISLAKKAVNHEARIKELEKEIKRLKEERYGDR